MIEERVCICLPEHLAEGSYDAECPVHDVIEPARSPLAPSRREDHETNSVGAAAAFERDRDYDRHEDRWGAGAPREEEL